MTMTLGNTLGIYLVIGTLFYGASWAVRARWAKAGKLDQPKGNLGRLATVLGLGVGVLFWPVILVAMSVIWRVRRKNRKVERFLGFCEHATAFDPYCGPCSRDLKQEEDGEISVVGRRRAFGVASPTPPEGFDMDRTCRVGVASYLLENPACPGCGKTGTLGQFMESFWVKCTGCDLRIFTPDPSAPQEIDDVPPPGGYRDFIVRATAKSAYDCSACKKMFEGVPAGATSDGWPLCGGCKPRA